MGFTAKMAKTLAEDLPEDCWESIFGRLLECGRRHLQPISLVNKRFLDITGRLHTCLTFSPPSFSCHLPRVCSRFPNLRSIHLSHPHPDLDGFLRELANSDVLRLSRQTSSFPRQAMGLLGRSANMRATLRTLSYCQLYCLTDDDFIVVADCFAYLHHLGLHGSLPPGNRRSCGGLTDKGVCAISSNLASLVSFTVSFDEQVSLLSFATLSSSCPLLSHLRAAFTTYSPVHLHYFTSLASLSSLDLSHVFVDETGFDQLSEANFQLRKLVLRAPKCGRAGVNAAAVCRFLKSCRSLTHLKLKFMALSKDAISSDFVASIPNVQCIHLCNVRLPNTILFDMLVSCPNLSEIVLTMTFVGMVDYILDPPLVLTGHGYSDETLALIGSICPNLESFYFGDIPEVTEQGIEAMRARCCNIKICQRIYNSVWKDKEKNDSSSEEEDSSSDD